MIVDILSGHYLAEGLWLSNELETSYKGMIVTSKVCESNGEVIRRVF